MAVVVRLATNLYSRLPPFRLRAHAICVATGCPNGLSAAERAGVQLD